MVNVECPGCGSSYSVAEKRIPEGGLKMRCPKCSESFTVAKPAGGAAPAAPRPPARTVRGVGAPAPPPRKEPLFGAPPADGSLDDIDSGWGSVDDGDGFGMLDLSLPDARSGADLPMPRVGDDDLPMPRATDADLPMPRRAEVADLPTARKAEVADLPMPRRAAEVADLPMPRAAEVADLPTPRRAEVADLPMPAAELPVAVPPRPPVPDRRAAPTQPSRYSNAPSPTEADLPMPAPDLPSPAPGAGGRGQTLGLDDLPAVAHDNLPALAHDNLPAVAHDNLPAVAHDNLPALAHDNLPVPADQDLPIPADQDFPAVGPDLPIPIDQDLPLPSDAGDLPLPADFNFPTRIGTSGDNEIPVIDSDPGLPLPGGLSDELRSDKPGDSLPPELKDAALASLPPQLKNADLASLPPNQRVEAPEPAAPGSEPDEEAPRVRIKKKRSRALKIAVVAVPIMLFALGAGPFLAGGGVFGWNWIVDALKADEHAATLTSFREAAQRQLEADTASEAKKVLDQALAQQREMPRYAPMTAYTAYLAFYSCVRFGTDPGQLATGKQLLESLAAGPPGPMVQLAAAARAAADKDYGAARASASTALGELQNDPDALVLLGYIELADRKATPALTHFTKAAELQRSARAVFGMAQSSLWAKQPDRALEHARATLKLSPQHAGARTLLAQLLWEKDPRSVEPVKLLEDVIAPGAVRSAASKDELVKAYALYGTIQIEGKHLGAAEKAFAEALKLEPQSRLALIGSGELFYQSGRYSEALARFETAYRSDNKDVLAGVGMAKTRLALEQAKEALAQLETLGKQHKHPEVGLWLGRALEAQGQREKAEAAYRSSIAAGDLTSATTVQAYVALASLLGSMGKDAEAEKVLQEASEKLPESANLHFAKGKVALNAGRLADAQRELNQALELDDKDLRARFHLGITLRRMRDHSAAKIAFDDVAKADPEYPGLALERGVLFHEMGELDKALEAYSNALKTAPDDVDLKLRVGSTQVISGHPDQAVKLLREVLEKRPSSAEVNHFLGRALLLRGDAQEGLRFLQQAIRFDPNRAEYHLYVAWAANEAGQSGVAEEAIAKALELDKNLGDAYWQRAVTLQKRGKTLDALKDLEIALAKNPSRAEAYATMALCYQDQSNYTKAEETWRKALELKDDVAEWHYRLGKILFDRNARLEGAQHLDKSVALSKEKKQSPGWLWNANFLVGEALRTSDPKRALDAYREFVRLTTAENAYRADAESAIEELETQLGSD